jgi:hypothetical protein
VLSCVLALRLDIWEQGTNGERSAGQYWARSKWRRLFFEKPTMRTIGIPSEFWSVRGIEATRKQSGCYNARQEVAAYEIHQISDDLRAQDSNSQAVCPHPLPEPTYGSGNQDYAERAEKRANVTSSRPKRRMG